MSKTITASTASPWRLSTGNGVYKEDVQAVIEQQNYTCQRITNSYLNIVTAQESWGSSGDEEGTHNVIFPTTATTDLTYQTEADIDADGALIYVEAYVNIGTGADCDVVFSIGSASTITLAFPSAGAANVNTTISRALTGTGWQTIKVNLRTNTVGSADSQLLSLRVEDQPLSSAALIPDPIL